MARLDRVIMVMENSIESAQAYYGVLKAGGICVEIHDRSTPEEVSYCIADSGARFCILSENPASRLAGVDARLIVSLGDARGLTAGRFIPWDALHDMPDTPPDASVGPDDPAAIVYTSGSTGRPKGVVLTHGNICSNTASIVSYLGLGEDDRVMCVLPFHYVYGKSLLNTHVMAGGSVVINNRFAFPNAVVKEMIERCATGFAGVPSTFAILMNRSVFPKTRIDTLRYVTQAGGAMAPALTRRVMDCISPAQLFVMYGATEASARLTYVPPDRLRDKIGSIGIPIPGVEVAVRDASGAELGPNEAGDICAAGPNIMKGYWQDPEETAKALRPWGLVTGDLGYKDEDGFIFLTGRRKDMLKIGGERVSPKEIEDAIVESGMVHEAAVVGRPDELLQEVPEAFVVPLDPKAFDLDALKTFIVERLSAHKLPRSWNVVKELPKKPSGKIDKEALKNEALHEMCVA
jgi:acyl-CoA synthetase (AMP-forming)/AMP-acid ligase II